MKEASSWCPTCFHIDSTAKLIFNIKKKISQHLILIVEAAWSPACSPRCTLLASDTLSFHRSIHTFCFRQAPREKEITHFAFMVAKYFLPRGLSRIKGTPFFKISILNTLPFGFSFVLSAPFTSSQNNFILLFYFLPDISMLLSNINSSVRISLATPRIKWRENLGGYQTSPDKIYQDNLTRMVAVAVEKWTGSRYVNICLNK